MFSKWQFESEVTSSGRVFFLNVILLTAKHNCVYVCVCVCVCVYIYIYIYCEIHRTVILPVVLYGCESWSLTLREERRLRVFDNRVVG